QPNSQGLVQTGAFFQVEFMIRDSKKYASTLGWGWGRWRGADLTPYGKHASFTRECVGCHTPMRNADYVFTEAIGGQQ
ncbi:MAG TPA: cytochrome P460 family protein, partial [Candidatus Aquilonibacter sp.]|nr:cytochrome P460 family protein [Candidatus Aquilonibacter sp.]